MDQNAPSGSKGGSAQGYLGQTDTGQSSDIGETDSVEESGNKGGSSSYGSGSDAFDDETL